MQSGLSVEDIHEAAKEWWVAPLTYWRSLHLLMPQQMVCELAIAQRINNKLGALTSVASVALLIVNTFHEELVEGCGY